MTYLLKDFSTFPKEMLKFYNNCLSESVRPNLLSNQSELNGDIDKQNTPDNELKKFRRAVKRDKSHYSTLKDESYFDFFCNSWASKFYISPWAARGRQIAIS